MIEQHKLLLALPERCGAAYSWAYPLYSALLAQAEGGFASSLHEQGATPVASSFVPSREGAQAVWTVNLLNDAACGALSVLLAHYETVSLRHMGISLKVLRHDTLRCADENEALRRAAQLSSFSAWSLRFLTPTSFRTADSYALFPSAELLVKSLCAKWEAMHTTFSLEDEDMLRLLLAGVRLTGYQLGSSYYSLKGTVIPGFLGSVRLSVRLSPPLMEIWKLLMFYAGFSGVGIKTALGMGGVTAEPVK